MPDSPPTLDAAATGWVLFAAALVLLMTPGVAFFYGGMVRARNVLGTVAQSFMVMGVVSVVWLVGGFSVAFGPGGAFFGDLSLSGLTDLTARVPGLDLHGVPIVAFALFQMMFAVVAPALMTGGFAERWRFGAFIVFVALWSLLVYAPIAHWVFSPSGWAARMGALDFAGGAVVHASAGAGAIACALSIGPRTGWPERHSKPHNLPMVLLGTALLWFGWFGFNAGSALRPDGVAAVAAMNTQVSAGAGLVAWALVERMRFGKSTTLGMASGAVAGLVAVTPAAGYVHPLSAVLIGCAAGVFCHLAVGLKSALRLDDSLDVAAVHLVGGGVGVVAVGFLASRSVNPAGADGLLFGGGYRLLGVQTLALLAVSAYAFCGTYLLSLLTQRFLGNRVSRRAESRGLDLTQHGEIAYEFDLPVSAVRRTNPMPELVRLDTAASLAEDAKSGDT